MHTQAKETKMWRWTTIIMTLLFMNVVLVPTTQGADEIAGRNVQHTLKVETMEVGDVPGHIVGVIQNYGLAFYTKGPDGGKIATRIGTFLFDVVNGKGTLTGHEVKTFQDGSTIFIKSSGTQTPADGGKTTVLEGTWEITGGTERFKGIKGKGTYKGERIGSPKTGGDSYIDFTGTEWKE